MVRNVSLDTLKVISCFGVVMLHVSGLIATETTSFTWEDIYYYLATFSIPIFFAVNGYLLLNKKEINYKYVFKKICAILLVVVVWNILISVASAVLKQEINNPIDVILDSLIQKGYFLQFWFFGSLIIIYLVLPILFRIYNIKIGLFLFVLFLVISIVIDILSIKSNYPLQAHVIQTFRLWTWFMYYLLGGILGNKEVRTYLTKKISFTSNVIMSIVLLVASISYEIFLGDYINKYNWAEYFYDNILVILFTFSFFLLISRVRFPEKIIELVQIISPNIMGIYIIHITFIKVFTHIFDFNSLILNLILVFLVFISSLIFTIILRKIPYVNKIVVF